MTASPQTAAGATTGEGEPRWLSRPEQEAWTAVSALMLQLPGPLDAQLQQDSGLTLFEYLVLSSLSMAPDRTSRMSELARLANGSQSRLSNVAKRLEERGWLIRQPDPADGRGTVAPLTHSGPGRGSRSRRGGAPAGDRSALRPRAGGAVGRRPQHRAQPGSGGRRLPGAGSPPRARTLLTSRSSHGHTSPGRVR